MNILTFAIVFSVLTATPVILQLRSHPRGLVILFFAHLDSIFTRRLSRERGEQETIR